MPHGRNTPVIGWATPCSSPPSGSPSSSPWCSSGPGCSVRGRMRWKALLLLASVVFFGWWDWQAVPGAGAAGGRGPGRRDRCAPLRRRLPPVPGSSARRRAPRHVRGRGAGRHRRLDGRRRRTARARPARDAARHLATSSTSVAACCAPAPLVDVALAPQLLPRDRRRPARAPVPAAAPARHPARCRSARSPRHPRGEGLPPPGRRSGVAVGGRAVPRRRAGRSGLRRPGRPQRARRCSWPSTASPCSSSPTWPATPRWPSARRSCSACGCPRTSTRRSPPRASGSSGGAGPRRSRSGSATTSTSRWAATVWRGALEVRNLLVTILLAGLLVRRRLDGPGVGCGDGCGAGHRAAALIRRTAGAGSRGMVGHVQRRRPRLDDRPGR